MSQSVVSQSVSQAGRQSVSLLAAVVVVLVAALPLMQSFFNPRPPKVEKHQTSPEEHQLRNALQQALKGPL